jgi:hypothetical protein
MSTQAVRAEDFTNSIGINTHLDFAVTAYSNVSVVESALNYLGVKQVRDAMQFATSPALFAQVAAATGIKYDLFLAPGPEADLAAALQALKQLPTSATKPICSVRVSSKASPTRSRCTSSRSRIFRASRSFRKASPDCLIMAPRAISRPSPILATPTPISAPATIRRLATGSAC